jgi:hypothetical protein
MLCPASDINRFVLKKMQYQIDKITDTYKCYKYEAIFDAKKLIPVINNDLKSLTS